ncbi:MAG: GTPase Era [Gammaproteobacteria bacterium]
MSNDQRCAYVAIIGRPNVGKSSILNRCIGQKISITSRKPQTTRFRLQGIYTEQQNQLIFVDTPGWQQRPSKRLNRMMNKEIDHALEEVDLIVMVAEARRWLPEDDAVAGIAQRATCPKILVLNKLDRLNKKDDLLPKIKSVSEQYDFQEILPTNAVRGDNIDKLKEILISLAPKAPHVYAQEDLTDKPVRFLVAELLREKLMRTLGDELPYAISVVIDKFEETDRIDFINATIWIERSAQKGIVIGKQGARLKSMASAARRDMEILLDKRVHLETWVKLRPNWSDDSVALSELDFKS